MVFQGFINGSYYHRSRSVDNQRCVNWYPEIVDSDSKNRVILSPTPGTDLYHDTGRYEPMRGLYTASNGRVFGIAGTRVYELFYPAGSIQRGVVQSASGMVSMADNGNQMMIVDGDHGYIYDMSTNLVTIISHVDFPDYCSHVKFINGRFVINVTNSVQFNLYWSDLYDGNTWNPLSVASAEYFADRLVAMEKANNQLWLFGTSTTEVFYDTGDADQPFQRVSGACFDNGTSAPHSPASTGNIVLWLGSNAQGQGIVWMATGYQPQRVSDHAIEYLLQSTPRIDDAIGFCYQQDGHSFYVLNLPTANRTLVYDITTNRWHERSTYNNVTDRDDRHVGICHCYAFNRNLIGSRNDGKIYTLSKEAYTDYGRIIRRERTSPHVYNENKRVFYKSFELDIEKGQGLVAGQGQHPNIMLQYSNDGGYTWGSELWRTAGHIGQFSTRVKWYNLGMGRDRVFRVMYTDPTPCTLINAYIDVEAES